MYSTKVFDGHTERIAIQSAVPDGVAIVFECNGIKIIRLHGILLILRYLKGRLSVVMPWGSSDMDRFRPWKSRRSGLRHRDSLKWPCGGKVLVRFIRHHYRTGICGIQSRKARTEVVITLWPYSVTNRIDRLAGKCIDILPVGNTSNFDLVELEFLD